MSWWAERRMMPAMDHDPITLTLAAVSLVGGGVAAVGAKNTANANAAAANYSAQVDERNAAAAKQQALAEGLQKDRENRRQLAAIRASYGASGLDAFGSPLDVLEDSALEGQKDVANVIRAGDIRAIGYQDDAKLKRMEAQQAKSAGTLSAVTALFGGASDAGKSLLTMK